MTNKTYLKNVEYEVYKYARENLAIINIFIKESYTKRFRKTEKMSRISYIASSGGLLGLCMGFSFVSLAEILYHCFLCVAMVIRHESSRLLRKDLWKKQNTTKSTQENGKEKDKRASERFVPPRHTLLWSHGIAFCITVKNFHDIAPKQINVKKTEDHFCVTCLWLVCVIIIDKTITV